MVLLLLAFFRLQILGNHAWELRAESNRIRQLPISVPRGGLFDRYGRVVADNVPGHTIVALPTSLASFQETLGRIAKYADLSDREMERFSDDVRRYGAQPIVIDRFSDFETVSAIEERRDEFPDIYVDLQPKRRYPAGRAVAHLAGYVGEISRGELESSGFTDSI